MTRTFKIDSSYVSADTSALSVRLDAQDLSLFYEQNLREIDPQIKEEIRSPLSAFNLFYIQKTSSPDAKSYEYTMIEKRGKSKIGDTSEGLGMDAPIVTMGGKKYLQGFVDIYCSIEYSARDIRVANATGVDVAFLAKTQAMRSNYETMNQICFLGDTKNNIPGLATNKYVGTADSGAIDLAVIEGANTSEAVLAKLISLVQEYQDKTKSLIQPNVLAVSPKIYASLTMTPWAAANGTANIASVFTTSTRSTISSSGIAVVPAPELAKGVPFLEATGNTKEYAILMNNSREIIQHMVAETFYITPPQELGLGYRSICLSRSGGLSIVHPKAIMIIKNKT